MSDRHFSCRSAAGRGLLGNLLVLSQYVNTLEQGSAVKGEKLLLDLKGRQHCMRRYEQKGKRLRADLCQKIGI